MEPAIAVELVNCNQGMKEDKFIVRGIVGDDNTCAIDRIKKGAAHKIFKFFDPNHLNKNFGKQIYELKKSLRFNELKKKGVVKHIFKLFEYAVAQHKKIQLASQQRFYPSQITCSINTTNAENGVQVG